MRLVWVHAACVASIVIVWIIFRVQMRAHEWMRAYIDNDRAAAAILSAIYLVPIIAFAILRDFGERSIWRRAALTLSCLIFFCATALDALAALSWSLGFESGWTRDPKLGALYGLLMLVNAAAAIDCLYLMIPRRAPPARLAR